MAWRRRASTGTPLMSAAVGFSPTARTSSPQPVRCTAHQTAAAAGTIR